MKRIVLDASAVITFFEDRPGAEKVEDLIRLAVNGKRQLLMSVVNWGEVYYSTWRSKGPGVARKIIEDLANNFDREVPYGAVGTRVMQGLRAVDPVAYVRYASIYRRFDEATDFVQEVKKLEKPHDTLTARLPGI